MSSLRNVSWATLTALGLSLTAAAGATPPLFLVDTSFSDNRTTIHTVDPATGVLSLAADLGVGFSPMLGLAAANGRILYATGTDTSTADACEGLRSCMLLRIELDPDSPVPASFSVIGPVRTAAGVVPEIIGLTFRSDGMLYATSQETDGLYVVDPGTAEARMVGVVDLDLHGGDTSQGMDGRLWAWSNIGDASGLYLLDPNTAAASAYQLYPGLNLAGLSLIGHDGPLAGGQPAGDRLLLFDPVTGLAARNVRMSIGSAWFDFSRGDLDSPFCADDSVCDDGDPETVDRCTAGGCRFEVASQDEDIETMCPCDGPGRPWKNHGEYVSCVARAASHARSGGRSLVSEAARSSCGKGQPNPDVDYSALRPGRGRQR